MSHGQYSLRFSKDQRLLKPSDFSAVFDAVDYKVSNRYFLILAKKNGAQHPRLGIIVAKKNIKLAVSRNIIKRLTRESFRHQQHNLQGIDAIVLPRKGLEQLSNHDARQQLDQLWLKIQKKVAHS